MEKKIHIIKTNDSLLNLKNTIFLDRTYMYGDADGYRKETVDINNDTDDGIDVSLLLKNDENETKKLFDIYLDYLFLKEILNQNSDYYNDGFDEICTEYGNWFANKWDNVPNEIYEDLKCTIERLKLYAYDENLNKLNIQFDINENVLQDYFETRFQK